MRTKVRELTKLGGDVKDVIRLSFRGHGPWWCSGTREVQFALNNNYFPKQLELVSIRDLWIQVHYPSCSPAGASAEEGTAGYGPACPVVWGLRTLALARVLDYPIIRPLSLNKLRPSMSD